MGKFDGILITTDLDGTLYKNDKTISEKNKKAIAHFKSEGGLFTFVTGRMPYYSMAAYEAVAPNAPFGCINGGGVYDGEAKKYIEAKTLPPEALALAKHIDQCVSKVGIQICCLENTYFCKETPEMARFRAETGLPNLACHYTEVKEPVAKVIFGTDDEEKIALIAKLLREHPLAEKFDFIRSQINLFEILPKGVDKGLSISSLARHLRLDEKKTVAVGDYDNDVGMLRAAGLGVAVKNASPAALAAADVVTVSNEEDAIAHVIAAIECGEYKL